MLSIADGMTTYMFCTISDYFIYCTRIRNNCHFIHTTYEKRSSIIINRTCLFKFLNTKSGYAKSIATMKNHHKQFLRFYNLHLQVGLTFVIMISKITK